jgi:cation diffusion facilitator family transporter
MRAVLKDLASRAALLSLVANLALMVLKVSVGLITGSIAVLSDGVDSGQDVLASGIVLVSVRFGRRPPDLAHPYGHGRAETLAASGQAALIMVGAAFIAFQAVHRFLNPPEGIQVSPALIAIAITAAVNLLVIRYVAHAARATRSPALEADLRHLWTNVAQALGVFVALALVEATGEVVFDAAVAAVLGAYLAFTAAAILWSVIADVMDRSLPELELAFIEETILRHPGPVQGFHRLRTRRSGQHRYVDFHLIVPADLRVDQCHEICDEIESALKGRWPTAVVTIHAEPADGRFRGPREPGAAARGREGEAPQ